MKNDMKKNLILITTSFPYGKLEPFIESELNYYKNFDKVLCLAIHRNGEPREIKYPENFEFQQINEYKFKRDIKYALQILFNRNFWAEVATLVKSSRFTVKNIHHLISLGLQTEHYYRAIKKVIEKFEKNDSCDNKLYFYSYWMVEHAMAGIRLKKRFKNSINLTRAHGYDLYEYRDKGKYIPFRKYILNNTNYVLPISSDGFEYLNQMYGTHNNIILSRLGTKDCGLPLHNKSEYELRIVSCSWCTGVKRIDLIIKALSRIKSARIQWIHLGDGDLYDELLNLAKTTLPSNIDYNFKGAVTNVEILDFYKNNHIDLFLNTSSTEGIPVSIMEVQSFGIPVIATDVGGVKEIITCGKNGYLLEKNFEIQELTTLIEEYIAKPLADKEILRKNARTMWEEHFSAQKNYNYLFDEIISL